MLCSTSSSSTLYYFSPHAQARPNTARNKPGPKKVSTPTNHRKQSKPPKLKSRNFPPPPPPLLQKLSAVHGGEATTYTRLPPKDDFFLDDYEENGSIDLNASEIVKLSESKLAKVQNSSEEIEKSLNFDDGNVENGGKLGFDYGKFELYEAKVENLSEEIETSLDFDGENLENGGKLGFDYGKFELYEVDDSDLECGDEVDFDENEGKGEFFGFGDQENEEIKEKEKGVPAIMRCFDRAKIYVKAGDGGNGVVAFRREKFVPLGGPSGGDGGRGGNVYVEVDGSMNSLLPFRQSVHYRAGRGAHGQGSKQNGAKGEDVVVKVPPGTVIRDAVGKGGVEGDVLLELLHPGQRALLLPGGRGGRGNASFKSGMNKVPKIAENGEEGLEM